MSNAHQIPSTPGQQLCSVLIGLCVMNFIAFYIVSSLIGGDAINGKIEYGQYFLGEHGRFTQVSQAIFAYSRWHMLSLFMTHPLGMLSYAVRMALRRGVLHDPCQSRCR
jgi:hypothetical protein